MYDIFIPQHIFTGQPVRIKKAVYFPGFPYHIHRFFQIIVLTLCCRQVSHKYELLFCPGKGHIKEIALPADKITKSRIIFCSIDYTGEQNIFLFRSLKYMYSPCFHSGNTFPQHFRLL